MATRVETQQCFPKPYLMGNTAIIPSPEPDHEHCPGGWTVEGVLGGWKCPCPCHRDPHYFDGGREAHDG